MAVTASKNDTAGAALDATTAAIQTIVNASTGLATLQAAQQALVAAQTAQLEHYLANGRISASAALTALSLSATNLPTTQNANAKYGAWGSNIGARITTLTSAAAGGQPYTNSAAIAAQQLAEAQKELLRSLIETAQTSAATILSTLS